MEALKVKVESELITECKFKLTIFWCMFKGAGYIGDHVVTMNTTEKLDFNDRFIPTGMPMYSNSCTYVFIHFRTRSYVYEICTSLSLNLILIGWF